MNFFKGPCNCPNFKQTLNTAAYPASTNPWLGVGPELACTGVLWANPCQGWPKSGTGWQWLTIFAHWNHGWANPFPSLRKWTGFWVYFDNNIGSFHIWFSLGPALAQICRVPDLQSPDIIFNKKRGTWNLQVLFQWEIYLYNNQQVNTKNSFMVFYVCLF